MASVCRNAFHVPPDWHSATPRCQKGGDATITAVRILHILKDRSVHSVSCTGGLSLISIFINIAALAFLALYCALPLQRPSGLQECYFKKYLLQKNEIDRFLCRNLSDFCRWYECYNDTPGKSLKKPPFLIRRGGFICSYIATRNACSKLYGACCRIGFAMGYERIITYTLATEGGTSLRAAGFIFDGEAGGKQWTGQRRRSYYVAPAQMKRRWIKERT